MGRARRGTWQSCVCSASVQCCSSYGPVHLILLRRKEPSMLPTRNPFSKCSCAPRSFASYLRTWAGMVLTSNPVTGCLLLLRPPPFPLLQEEVVAAALAQRNIPPHNPAATTAEEAYPVDGLVPPAVRDSLEIRRLFPACDKPDYRETLKTSGQVAAAKPLVPRGLPGMFCLT